MSVQVCFICEALLEVSGHGLRSGPCSMPALSQLPLSLTSSLLGSFGLLGVFLSNSVFHPVADRCVRRRLLATSIRLATLQWMTGAAEGKNSRAERPFDSQFLPSSSPVSRFQPLYR